jgi:uncharacterized membrane protein YoaK (UPF0700 family)
VRHISRVLCAPDGYNAGARLSERSNFLPSVERDLRLLILAASAGSADGWSYFGLGHAFVANMTGNTVLLGLAVFQNHGDFLHPLISLAGYAVGAVIGSLMAGKIAPGTVWSKTISRALLLEAIVLLAAEAAWIAIHLHPAYRPQLNLLLAAVALAIGLQSGAMVQLKVPGVVTTYITGTWTTLLSSLARLRKHEQQTEERLLLQAAVLAIYFVSAVLTGWLFRNLPLAVGALPAATVLWVAIVGLLRRSSDTG